MAMQAAVDAGEPVHSRIGFHRTGYMLPRDRDIYASAPLRQLLDEQARAMAAVLQRCSGTHALLVSASTLDAPPALPMLGSWVRLWAQGGRYDGDLRAATDEALPFVDDAFELVLLRHSLEVVVLAADLLAEAVRVLAPGGVLVVTGVHPISAWAPWFCWRARGAHRAMQMPMRLRRRLRQAGLEIERVQRVGRSWPRVGGARPGEAMGGGYVLLARKRRRASTPLRIKSVPLRVPVNSQLSPGSRRHATP